MITIAADSETTTDNRVKQALFIVEPNYEQLIRIGDLLESGALHPVVDAVLPLTQASAAYTGEVREKRDGGAESSWLRSHMVPEARRPGRAGAGEEGTYRKFNLQRPDVCFADLTNEVRAALNADGAPT